MAASGDLVSSRTIEGCGEGAAASYPRLAAAVSGEGCFQTAAAMLAARPGVPSSDLVAAVLKRHYGLAGSTAMLSSEIEQTVAVELADGRRLILKLSTRPESIESFRFQSAALAGLEKAAADVRVPRVMRTCDGGLMFEAEGVCGYLQTRVEGVALHQATATPELLFRTGSALARLDMGLARIEPPAAHRPVLWNIQNWPQLMQFTRFLPCGNIGEQIRAAMADYLETAEPQIAGLVWQVTHNDPSPHNMMVTGEGVGFIDFGDGGWNPRIQDLAIAASHVVTDPALPLGGAEHLVAGYASVLPLSALEARLLVRLMRARHSALILVNSWRAQLFPDDAEYIRKNVARAERGLSILASLDAASGEAAVHTAISLRAPGGEAGQLSPSER